MIGIVKVAALGAVMSCGALAVYDLLTCGEGRFEFNAGAVEGEDEIGSSTSFLLMEGARLQDERNQGKARN